MIEQRFDYDDAARARDFILERLRETGREGEIQEGLNLGSGLGAFAADHMDAPSEVSTVSDHGPLQIPFEDIFAELNKVDGRLAISIPEHKVEGHAQRLIVGNLSGTPESELVVAQSGREHPYEGISTKRATFWLRVMQLLQAKAWIGSNASGVLTPATLTPPAIMLVEADRDEGSDNPLIGSNDERFGPRFPHMSGVYPSQTLEIFDRVAKEQGIELPRGVYIRRSGPNYERPEDVYEYRAMLERIWEQAAGQKGETRFKGPVTGVVGMSSTYEAMVAQHASQSKLHPAFQNGRALVSATTNYSASLGAEGLVAPSSHDEVGENARIVQDAFGRLVRGAILEMRKTRS